MNSKTIHRIHTIGKAGKIVTIILIVCMLIASVVMAASAVIIAALPRDAVSANISADIDVSFSDEVFAPMKEKTVDKINNDTAVSFSDDTFGISAEAADDSTLLHIHTDQFLVQSGDAVPILLLALCNMAGILVCLFFFKALMRELSGAASPFTDGVVRKLRNFAISLLPAALVSSVSRTLITYLFSINRSLSMSLNLGPVAFALVIFVLVMIFNYGVQLQKESDETF